METVEVRPALEKQGEAKQPVTPQPEKPKRKPGRPPSGTGPGRPPSGKGPGRPPSGTRPGRSPSGTRSTPVDADFKKLRLHNSLASLLANLKKELRLRSDSDTVHWLLHKARPDLVRSPPAGSPRPPRPAPESVPPVYFSYSDGGEESASDSPVAAGSDPLRKPPVRATVVQASSVFFDTPVTLEKAERLVSGAAAYGSQLVVFPEAFIGGYPRGIVFDTAAATHSTGQETDYQKYYASAINVPGPEVERLAKIASKFKVHLVMGVVERAGSYLYSTVLLFDSLGRPLGQQRKQMLMASESGVWNSGEKLSPPVFKTSIGKVGGLLCWDNRSPLLRTELYTKGVEIYCAPTADGREVWQASVTHIALEGSCFVLSANQFCHRQDHPIASRDSNGGESVDVITCGGGSVIVSPSGTILAGPNYQGECLISADLDFGEIAHAKKDFGEIRSNVGPTANGSNSVFFERDKKTEVPDQPSWCQYMVPTPTGSCLAV